MGKSFLINALADKITLTYPAINGPSVVICAPTGVSAYILKGSTCHRVFQLNVQHGSTPKYEPLSKDKIKSLRTMLGYVRLFIIDKISMVSHLQLAFIHQRLQDVFGDIRKQVYPFANMSIVAFGDLFQLPPVNEKPVFSKISIQDARKSNLGIAGINLWSYFDYDELTINMRQKDDNENFVNILNRIRLGSPTDQDIEILKRHRINPKQKANIDQVTDLLQNLQKKMHIICIVPTNESAEEVNYKMLKKNNIHIIEISATDSNLRQKTVTKKKSKQTPKTSKLKKISDTAGLETVLKIGIGARCMLRRNIDIEKGLCNGTMGTVTEIQMKDGKVVAVTVKFDHMDHAVNVEFVQADYELSRGLFVTRSQIPLSLSYALTVHKNPRYFSRWYHC